MAPIFDNENMLDENSIYYGEYSIGIDESDYSFFPKNMNVYDNYIYKFINESGNYYKELLEEKLEIISSENINKIINKVEKNIDFKIPKRNKIKIIEKFYDNENMIRYILKISNKSKVYQLY